MRSHARTMKREETVPILGDCHLSLIIDSVY